jgi:hypothetical protein
VVSWTTTELCWNTAFCTEISHALSALPFEKVNEITKALLPKYGVNIKTSNVGKIVYAIYDLEAFKLMLGWQEICDEVRQKAIDLGIPLDN